MRKQNRQLLVEFIRPPLLIIDFVVKMIYGAIFGWWLDPWLQRKANQSLIEDIRAKLPFLFPIGDFVRYPRIRVLPFDYASVELGRENLLFSFTRGREETSVVVAPRWAPDSSYELGPVMAALEGKQYSDRYAVNNLHDVAKLLQPHLHTLNAAFSEREFPTIKQRLW